MGDGGRRHQVLKVPRLPQRKSLRLSHLLEEAGSPFSNAEFCGRTPRGWLMTAAPRLPLW